MAKQYAQYPVSGGGGDVKGPASAINGDIAVFDGTTGKLIKDGGAISGFANAPHNTNILDMTGGTGSIVADLAHQQLFNGMNAVLDWSLETLNDTGGGPSLNWGQRYGVDSTSALSYDWQARTLLANGFTVLDWQNGAIYSSGQLSIDFANFELFDLSGSPGVDYGNNVLKYSNNPRVDWAGMYLYSSANFATVQWDNTNLVDNSSIQSMNWGSRLCYNSSGQLTLDYNNRQTFDSSAAKSSDWDQRILYWTNGTTALLNWSQTRLYDQAGVLSEDWGGRTLNDGGGNKALGWSASGIDISAIVTKYNNISTSSNGVPAVFAAINLTTQAAAITSTILINTGSATSYYRISWSATITRAASTSSVLGGTNGFQISYTDRNDNVVKTSVAGPTVSTNTTGTCISGVLFVYSKFGSNINYTMGYTSVGVTTMQYDLSAIVEAL